MAAAVLRLLGEVFRANRKPPAVLVQVDEAATSFDGGREARDDMAMEGDAVVVGESHFVSELEVAGHWGRFLRVRGQVVLGTIHEVGLVLEGCHVGLEKVARTSPCRACVLTLVEN